MNDNIIIFMVIIYNIVIYYGYIYIIIFVVHFA